MTAALARRVLPAMLWLVPPGASLAAGGPVPFDQFAPVPEARVLDRGEQTGQAMQSVTHAVRLAPAFVARRFAGQQQAARAAGFEVRRPILFGDLHVHTTYSDDAFWFSLPLIEGTTGVRPPTSACNYARFVSQLDFFAITDHAESYTPPHWKNTVTAVRQCNAVAGDASAPDVVAFLGYEWTSIGRTKAEHYGHHNVIFRDLEDGRIPKRPVAYSQNIMGLDARYAQMDPDNRSYYESFQAYLDTYRTTPNCPRGMSTTRMPDDCFEFAATVGELLGKLRELGAESLVIPHGMAWGYSQPLDSTWDAHLAGDNFDNARIPAIEIYSGHGNSEQYTRFAPRRIGADGRPYCPEPSAVYLPACWRAGEIVYERCRRVPLPDDECREREREARQNFVDVNTRSAWLTVPATRTEDWLDAGQARGMFLPPFNYRPLRSTQAALALTHFENGETHRFLWGFVGSSDTHRAKPGLGFKSVLRSRNIDTLGGRTLEFTNVLQGRDRPVRDDLARSRRIPTDDNRGLVPFGGIESERNSSFMYLGGLAAVHADGRSRTAIWDAIRRREVYATSGHRILLWFDLMNGPERRSVPMGGHVALGTAPRFRVRAIGSERQIGGCPREVRDALSEAGLESLNDGECHHPSDARLSIRRIEVVRIRPQQRANEDIDPLIEDPWKVLPCPGTSHCVAEFDDPTFARDALYYVRAIEEPTPTINGANLRTTFDAQGRPVAVDPCFDGYPTSRHDDCLAPTEHRAWSSPIYVDWTRPRPARQ